MYLESVCLIGQIDYGHPVQHNGVVPHPRKVNDFKTAEPVAAGLPEIENEVPGFKRQGVEPGSTINQPEGEITNYKRIIAQRPFKHILSPAADQDVTATPTDHDVVRN